MQPYKKIQVFIFFHVYTKEEICLNNSLAFFQLKKIDILRILKSLSVYFIIIIW